MAIGFPTSKQMISKEVIALENQQSLPRSIVCAQATSGTAMPSQLSAQFTSLEIHPA
jgi:hypothetical protein